MYQDGSSSGSGDEREISAAPADVSEGRVALGGAWFGDPGLERAFQRANMGATRQYLIMLGLIALAGAVASGIAAWFALPSTAALKFGTAWRALLALAAVGVVLFCRYAPRPWMLYACNAVVLSIGYVAIALRSSLPDAGAEAAVTVFHVSPNGMLLYLVVTAAQLVLVPGWFMINAAISAAALAGLLAIINTVPAPGVNSVDASLVGAIGYLFLLGMGWSAQRVRRNSFFARTQLQWANMKLNELATQDHLTGCANRRHFYAIAEAELARSRRYRRTMALVILDVDHFKSINDQYGHAAGDRVLTALSGVVRRALRELDSLGRIGGEEFALLLPETSADEAQQIAERLRAMIENLRVHYEGADLSVTASFGVTERGPDDRGIDAVMRRADFALYEAKANGRNRVEVTGGASRPRPPTPDRSPRSTLRRDATGLHTRYRNRGYPLPPPTAGASPAASVRKASRPRA